MWRAVSGRGGAIGLLLLMGAAAQPGVPDLAQALRNLSSDNWSVRQAAQQSLVRMGDAAEPALRAALKKSLDPETQSRIEDALHEIDANRISGPSMVTLDYSDADVKTILADLARQADAQIELGNGGFGMGAKIVSIHLHQVPFWVAIKELCDKTGLSPRFDNGDAILTLATGNDATTGIPHCQGPFMIIARQIIENAQLSLAPGQVVHKSLSLEMTMLAEPKLAIMGHGFAAHIQSALDDAGNSMQSDRQMFRFNPMFMNAVNGDNSHLWMCGVQLQQPDDHAKKIALLKGSFRTAIATQFQIWTVPNILKVQNLTRTFGPATYSIDAITPQGSAYMLRVSGTRSSANPEDNFLGLGEINLFDAHGVALTRRSMGGMGGGMGRMQYTFSFDPSDPNHPAGEPVKLVWKVPTATKMLDVPFEFRDLPLP